MAEEPSMNAADWMDDRPEDGVFRINRRAYTDDGLFQREMSAIFERCWLYLCHESQVSNPGDYVSTSLAGRPVFVIRDDGGAVRCFHDSCAHRGTRLTTGVSGNARTLRCRYHGWCFDATGGCTLVRGGTGGYPDGALDRLGTGLREIARFDGYKGFLFGALDPNVPDLDAFLGDARPFIDLMADQSPDGMEILRGESRYMMEANWKLQTENSTDGYHVATVHRNFATTLSFRDSLIGTGDDAERQSEASRILALDKIGSGGYDVGNGHMINWSDRGAPKSAPLNEARTALTERFGEEKVRWMIDRGRTVTIFPNLLLNDVASTCIRVWRPIGPSLTEIETWCLAPKGESADARRRRIRKYEEFFFPASLAVPDDVRAMEAAHWGSDATREHWNDFSLGLDTMVDGADDYVSELGVPVRSSNPGRESETPFYAFWREWRRYLEAER